MGQGGDGDVPVEDGFYVRAGGDGPVFVDAAVFIGACHASVTGIIGIIGSCCFVCDGDGVL